MTQDEFDTKQEYYETECDFSDFTPTVPMPEPPPDEDCIFHQESIRLFATILKYCYKENPRMLK